MTRSSSDNTWRSFFGRGRSVFSASAPGRLDVMGGISDYSGSLVLQMPIAERTTARAALRDDGVFRAYSTHPSGASCDAVVELPKRAFCSARGRVSLSAMREALEGDLSWASYILGCAAVLMEQKGASINGCDIWVDSHVPVGKGVSSSAALEVSTMKALAAALRLRLGKTELPLLAQRAENIAAGAPCGIMDQLASYLGQKNALLPILCQPADVGPVVTLPRGVRFVGIDSGVTHAVSGASYGDVRTAAFMGYTIVARRNGASIASLKRVAAGALRGNSKPQADRETLPFGGYLARVTPSEFDTCLRDEIPVAMTGREFLQEFHAIIDTVTTVSKQSRYAVLACTRHPVAENGRVRLFRRLLECLQQTTRRQAIRNQLLEELGELMFQSHASYSACGLGCAATDALVEAVREAGPVHGVYGARVTGGGSGGAVCVLCDGRAGVATAHRIARDHAREMNQELAVFDRSSPGAYFSPVRRVDTR